MSRLIELELERNLLRISFAYDRELVNVVRNLPERRWDPQVKSWFVPLVHLPYVLGQLAGNLLKMSEELSAYCEKQGISADERATSGVDVVVRAPSAAAGYLNTVRGSFAIDGREGSAISVPANTYTVSKLNEAARAVLRDHFVEDIWIVGELHDYDKNVSAGDRAYFFALTERPYEGAREVARIAVVMFVEVRRHIENVLASMPQPLRLRDGLLVRFKARVDLYPQNGRYQLIVSDIDPSYTVGELEMNRERVFRLLEAEGVHTNNLQKSFVACPLRVGLITSYESDAYNDFLHGLRLSGFGFELTTHHASVQGINTESSVLSALDYFAHRAEEFDVLVIVRGGGSRSDLAYFDTEAIGRAVCAHPLKIVIGVGHQRDQCLLDFIAHSTKTPTAAAELLVRSVQEFWDGVDTRFAQIAGQAQSQILTAHHRLATCSTAIERQASGRLVGERARMSNLGVRISDSAARQIARASTRVEVSSEQIGARARACLKRGERELDYARQHLEPGRILRNSMQKHALIEQQAERMEQQIARVLGRQREQVENAAHNLRLLDPQRVLERGFAILRSRGKLVRSTGDVPRNEPLTVTLADGVIHVERIDE